ncbi:hypothetical protein KA005_01580 [bacterium]|nr:hypothetical protein [bacterium]
MKMAFVIMPFDKKLKWSIKPMTAEHDTAPGAQNAGAIAPGELVVARTSIKRKRLNSLDALSSVNV